MTNTHLIYLHDFNQLHTSALVISSAKTNEDDVVILDRTVFYPQGGGQPYDRGTIESVSSRFVVENVRLIDNVVHHFGKFDTAHANFNANETVNCNVDAELRHLHSRIHSAGHLIDLAVATLQLGWIPEKAYHFPQGPYVQYKGNLEGLDKDKLISDIENLCKQFIHENRQTSIKFVSFDELPSICAYVPDYLKSEKSIRVILFGDFGIPCGGTHVNSLAEIKSMTIRKIKMERGLIRVSYDVERESIK